MSRNAGIAACALVIAAGCAVSLRSIRAFPNFSLTDEAIIYNYVDTFERTGRIEASLVPYPGAHRYRQSVRLRRRRSGRGSFRATRLRCGTSRR